MEADPSKKTLFDNDDDSSASDDKIQINAKYATAYQQRKHKQELKQFDDDADDSSTTSSSSEDEEGHLLTTSLDVNIIKTINALRSRDEQIYDPTIRFFDDNSEGEQSEASEGDEDYQLEKKQKPKRFKDVEREQVLEQMNHNEAVTQEDQDPPFDSYADTSRTRLAYDAQQQEIRQAFLESSNEKHGDNDSASEDLMILKSKRRASRLDDEESQEAQRALEQEIEKMKATNTSELVDPRGEVQNGDEFLVNFFKNRSWIDKDDDHSDDSSAAGDDELGRNDQLEADDDDDDASLEAIDKADDFEAQYNFRFEEAASKSGADLSMISYARGQTMNTLRRKDTSRREKRLARQERKALERQAKEEQLRRLKNAKRQEMNDKLKQIKTVLGEIEDHGKGVDESVDEATLLELLEGDFDPEKFESLMEAAYGEDFYKKEEKQWKTDQDVRATLKQDEDGDLLVGQDDAEGGLYDDDNDDNDERSQEEEIEASQDESLDEQEEEWPQDDDEQPPSALEQKIKEKMTDDLYKLDYEDIVAGMPTRFKYRQVEPNNYGLSSEEILFAQDRTLRQFVSLKNLAPYRQDEEHFVGSKRRRRFREMLKQDMEEAAESESNNVERRNDLRENEVEEPASESKKKRRRKRGKKKNEGTKPDESAGVKSRVEEPQHEEDVDTSEPKAKRRRRKKSSSVNKNPDLDSVESTKDRSTSGYKEMDGKRKSALANSAADENVAAEAVKKRKKRKDKAKKKQRESIEGVSDSRLASYGL